MRISRKSKSALVGAIVIILTLGLLTLSVGGFRTSSAKEQQKSHKEQPKIPHLPVVSYETLETGDMVSASIRQNRSSRYDKRGWVRENPNVSIVASNGHWGKGLPALPLIESDVVAVGQVTDAQAHLSTDKTGIYSEFTIKVEAIYKGVDSDALAPGKTITIAREGGAVKFPSGHIQRYIVAHQGMPRIGRRYLLFLKRNETEQSFDILTGYQLRRGKVEPLDSLSTFAVYNGVDETSFLNTVRDSINRVSQQFSSKGGERR